MVRLVLGLHGLGPELLLPLGLMTLVEPRRQTRG